MLENREDSIQVCNGNDAFVKVDYRPWNLVGLEESKNSQEAELHKDNLIEQVEPNTFPKDKVEVKEEIKSFKNEFICINEFKNPFESYMHFYSDFNKICIENWNSIAKIPVLNFYKFWN